MGYITVITIHNDAIHAFKQDPKQLGEQILAGIEKANQQDTPSDRPFSHGNSSYGGYISVFPSRHADDSTLYLSYGNSVVELGAYRKEFEVGFKSGNKFLERCVKVADSLMGTLHQRIEDIKKGRA